MYLKKYRPDYYKWSWPQENKMRQTEFVFFSPVLCWRWFTFFRCCFSTSSVAFPVLLCCKLDPGSTDTAHILRYFRLAFHWLNIWRQILLLVFLPAIACIFCKNWLQLWIDSASLFEQSNNTGFGSTTKGLFTWREENPSTRKILEGGRTLRWVLHAEI